MQGLHRLGRTDRTLLWGTAALIAFTLGAVAVARTNGGTVVGADDSRLCYNSAGVGAACLPPPPADFGGAAMPTTSAAPSPVVSEAPPATTASPTTASPTTATPTAKPPTTQPPTTRAPTTRPPTTTQPPASKQPAAKPAWAAGVAYAAGAQVSYQGGVYACRQSHTSQTDWSPPATPALWSRLS